MNVRIRSWSEQAGRGHSQGLRGDLDRAARQGPESLPVLAQQVKQRYIGKKKGRKRGG